MLCPLCQYTILAEDIDEEASTGLCRRCAGTFLLDQLPHQSQPSSILTVDHENRTIRWRWMHFWYALGLPFTLGVMAFTTIWYSGLFFGWIDNPPEEHAWLYLAGLFPLATALYCLYTTLAGFVNSTVIQVDSTTLTKKHQPFAWFYTLIIPRMEISRTVCEVRTRNNDGMMFTYYTLTLILSGGQEVALLSDHFFSHADRPLLQNKNAILSIKRCLDDWLSLHR